MTNLPLHLIQALVRAGECQNLEKAAKVLGITQPTLSRQLVELQSRLPFPIFVTQGRRKVLTSYGQRLCEALTEKLNSIPTTIQSVNTHFSDPATAKLRIVGRREILGPVVSKLQFKGSLEISYMSGADSVAELVDRRAQIAITQRAPDSTELARKFLFKRGFCLAIPKKFSPARPNLKDGSLLRILRKYPVALFSESFDVFNLFMKHLSLRQDELSTKLICADWLTLSDYVSDLHGWAVIPEVMIPNEDRVWTLPIPAHLNQNLEFGLIYLKDFGRLPWFKDFINRWPKPD